MELKTSWKSAIFANISILILYGIVLYSILNLCFFCIVKSVNYFSLPNRKNVTKFFIFWNVFRCTNLFYLFSLQFSSFFWFIVGMRCWYTVQAVKGNFFICLSEKRLFTNWPFALTKKKILSKELDIYCATTITTKKKWEEKN